jgi:hypothetical protein
MPVYTAYVAVLARSDLFVYTSTFKGHLKRALCKLEWLHLYSSFMEIKEKRHDTLEG